MNYNEYDSNGNKKKFDLSSIMNDRTQRSRFFLFVYLILFIILIFFIRANLNSKPLLQDNKEKEKEEQKETPKEIENESVELDEMFSFIELNNYEFIYNINMSNSVSVIKGKRYNDKFSFTLENNGSILYFNGTSNYIKAKETLDGEYKLTGFPYVLINCFDNQILKEIIKNATLNEEVYEITTKSMGTIVKQNLESENINTIKLVKNNNKITEIDLDVSDAMSLYMKENTKANINLKYSNFGLIDDFKIE